MREVLDSFFELELFLIPLRIPTYFRSLGYSSYGLCHYSI